MYENFSIPPSPIESCIILWNICMQIGFTKMYVRMYIRTYICINPLHNPPRSFKKFVCAIFSEVIQN